MSEVTANYMGYDKISGKYNVNVKNAHPSGNIGDAGYIRRFEKEDDAKKFTQAVNVTKQDIFFKEPEKKDEKPVRHLGDTFTPSFSSSLLEPNKKVKVEPCAKISLWRGMFSRLTDEQIKSVNETKELPQGTKFEPGVGGGFIICHNWFGLSAGTRTLPVGYELKKNVFGFTKVVPIGTEGKFIKDVK